MRESGRWVGFLVEEFEVMSLFVGLSIALTVILVGLSVFLKFYQYDFEKISPYECGFQPFSDARSPFTVSYYLIALLFIVFDIELVFFLPLVFVWQYVMTGVVVVVLELISVFLVLGYGYEWWSGSLEFSLD